MIEGMQKAMRINVLNWMEELCQPKHYICRVSGSKKALTMDVRIETLENLTRISSSALIDSGCTSSAINRAFVKKHNILTHATAMPITIYNADGSKNIAGQITAFMEVRIIIRDHAEHIDLAITELKDCPQT